MERTISLLTMRKAFLLNPFYPEHFNKEDRYADYLRLYDELTERG